MHGYRILLVLLKYKYTLYLHFREVFFLADNFNRNVVKTGI